MPENLKVWENIPEKESLFNLSRGMMWMTPVEQRGAEDILHSSKRLHFCVRMFSGMAIHPLKS